MPSSVTVLMAVHNGERFLARALESLRSQTLPKFEVLVIDDGSTDGTEALLQQHLGPTFSVYRNPENLGLTRSLNRGLALTRTDYIARLDADDVAVPNRLVAQAAFLDRHPEVGIVGSDCEVVDEAESPITFYAYPRSHTAIRWRQFFDNGFCHSGVMLRRAVLERHGLRYDDGIRCAQDFDLWTRLLHHTRGANLGTALVRWRMHPQSISTIRGSEQADVAAHVVEREVELLLGRSVDREALRELRGWYFDMPVCQTDLQWRAALLLLDMLDSFSCSADVDAEEARRLYGDWLVRLSRSMPSVRWAAWARVGLLRSMARPHWPRIAHLFARRSWRTLAHRGQR